MSDITDARPHAGELDSILKPHSIAVIGASRSANTIGHQIVANLVSHGFTGAVHPINPKATSIHSIRAYPSVRAIGAPVDLAIIAVPKERVLAVGDAIRWHHGTGAAVVFKDCRVPADHVLGKEGQSPLALGAELARGAPQHAAVNLGLGRAAYEAAVDYAKLRRQGGRNLVEHQAIGAKLADCAIKLELARNIIWKAAWALDHPDAVSGRSVSDLPHHVVARVYTAEAVNEVALLAAECFGAMGVMRDMPLQKYVHDSMEFLHSDDADGAAKLAVAEAVAGYQRPAANAA